MPEIIFTGDLIFVIVLYLIQIGSQNSFTAHSRYKHHFHCGQFKVCGKQVNIFLVMQNTEMRVSVFSRIISDNLLVMVVGRLSLSFHPRQVVRSPCGSASTRSTFLPSLASPIPKLTVVVVLPVPPF